MIDCINFLYIQQFSSECLEQRGKNLSLATSSLHSFFFVSHIQICVGGRVWKPNFFLILGFENILLCLLSWSQRLCILKLSDTYFIKIG